MCIIFAFGGGFQTASNRSKGRQQRAKKRKMDFSPRLSAKVDRQIARLKVAPGDSLLQRRLLATASREALHAWVRTLTIWKMAQPSSITRASAWLAPSCTWTSPAIPVLRTCSSGPLWQQARPLLRMPRWSRKSSTSAITWPRWARTSAALAHAD